MRRVVLVLASTMALAILLASGVAQAIINGEPDRGPNAHPYVGALVSVPPSGEFKGQRIPVCSGTLISPRVFLTRRALHRVPDKGGAADLRLFRPNLQAGSFPGYIGNPLHPPEILLPNF